MSYGDRRPGRRLAVACMVLAGFAIAGECASPGTDLAPRIVIKFAEGIAVTAEGKSLRLEASGAAAGFSASTLSAERAEIAQILARPEVSHVAPLFSDEAPASADLRRYVSLVLQREASDAAVDGLVQQLDALEIVETAYRAPVGEDAGIARPEE